MNRRNSWKIEYHVPEVPESFIRAGYNPLLASVLVMKGYDSVEKAESVLFDDEVALPDPFLLKGMREAVSRIEAAVRNGEKVAVFGDYDVDGITSTCILTDYLSSKGLEVFPYIPDRTEEGYGLNSDALDSFKKDGITLVITVDCGITAFSEAVHADGLGISMIITDHHECRPGIIPGACAVIDPKQPGEEYPNRFLAGVGVAFKLVCALASELDGEDSTAMLDRYSDLVAIGTVADVMPLLGENRMLVKTGLRMIARSPRPGIAAMLKETGVDPKSINASSIGFTIAPRLNASGRLDKAKRAVELLMCTDAREAENLAKFLCRLNRERQDIENSIWQEASARLSGKNQNTPIVLASEKWHQGVIGIAASRLAEQFSLPTIMIYLNGDTGKGSCRSYGGFNLFEALSHCGEHLISFGGHALAAGLNIKRDKIDDFRAALEEYYESNRPEPVPEIICDLLIPDASVLTVENVASLDALEPYGNANTKPVMCLTGVLVEQITSIGAGKHTKMILLSGGYHLEAVFFSHTVRDTGLAAGDVADVAFSPQINEFRGKTTVQLLVQAIRPHDPQGLCSEILEHGDSCVRAASRYRPERADFVRIWKGMGRGDCLPGRTVEDVLESCPEGMDPEKYCLCLAVFRQAGLLSGGSGVFGSVPASGSGKVVLEETPLLTAIDRVRSEGGAS